MSTTLPKFENDDRASLIVLDPTVIAAPTRAGEDVFALVPSTRVSGDST